MFSDLKALFKKYVVAEVDLNQLSKEALEALAFVLIDQLKLIASKTPGSLDDELIKRLAEWADKIDGQKDRT